MISQSAYKKGPEVYWIGKRVRARHDLHNEHFIAPAGTEFVIVRKYKGFRLIKADPCTCCGLRGAISEVRPELLDLIDDKGSLL